MKKYFTLSGFVMLSLSLGAQQLREGYIDWGNSGKKFSDVITEWTKGVPMSDDDNFFISRVKPKTRFRNVATQVNQGLNEQNDKNLLYWVPINKPPYNTLPDGVFDSEVFPMWSYITHFGNWSSGFVRLPGNFADVAHKNGVGVSVVGGIPWGSLSNEWKANLEAIIAAGPDKMADLLMTYGIDGLGYNSEFNTTDRTLIPRLNEFHKQLYAKMKATGKDPLYEMIWYDGTNDNGSIQFDNGLGSHNDAVFGTGENPVTTSMFFNYNWNRASLLANSVTKANEMGRNPLDLYAGFNMQGAEPRNGTRWPLLAQYPISIGLWGAHTQGMFYESRGEKGALPDVQQRTYMQRVERWFTGGSRNPVNTPELSNSMAYNADNVDFFGMSKMMSARSSLCWDLTNEPFITYFNLGNGKFFNWAGERKSDREWYNIGVQDYLPTWRWWFANQFMGRTPENVPASGLDAEFIWDDAWFGGSLMRVFGTSQNEYLHLFKTRFALQSSDVITVRYKVMSGSTNLSLALSAEGDENTLLAKNNLKLIETSSVQIGEWVEKKFVVRGSLATLNNKTIAMIGLHFENAQNLNLYLGEFSIVRGTFEKPATPQVTSTTVLAANHKGVDGKIIFNMTNDKPAGETCYNIDVKTSMFKLYAQQEGKEPVVMGATTSWAGMFYSVPFNFDVEGAKVRFGVSAVSMDSKLESDIAWGEYNAIDSYAIDDNIMINKTTIKPNEGFEISFVDPKHEASKFEILDNSGNVIKSAEGANTIIIADGDGINEIGAYSLRLTGKVGRADGSRVDSVRTFGAYVQITSELVGALPRILTLTANDQESDIEAEAGSPIVLKYTGKHADGESSQGVALKERGFGFKAGDMEMKPFKSFTLAFWTRVNSFNGVTNFINIRDKGEGWPKTDWGWCWNKVSQEGEFSMTFRGSDASSNNELRYFFANTKIEAGPWTHFAYVFDFNEAQQMRFHLYINGVKQEVTSWSRSDNSSGTGEPGYKGSLYGMRAANMVAFGGPSFGTSGVDGTIDNFQYWDKALNSDEVKVSMESFDDVPANLHGYWDIESKVNSEASFASTGVKKVGAGLHVYKATTGEGMGTIEWQSDVTYVPGSPFVKGSVFKVVTEPSWSVAKGDISQTTGNDQAGTAKVAFANEGVYTATLTLKNGWGTDSKTFQYITVNAPVGLEDVSLDTELQAYPNPFIDHVNVKFENEGDYAIRIYSLSGALVAEKQQHLMSGEMMQIRVNAEAGAYIAQILNNGKLVRAVKLIKK